MNNKIKRKPIVAATLIIALLLAVAMLGIMFFGQASPTQAAAYSLDDRQPSAQSISARQAFAEYDFDYSSINIILTHAATRQFIDYAPSDFLEVGALEVSDLTSYTVGYVQQALQNTGNGFRPFNDSGKEVLVDIDAFQRILSLTVESNSRERIFDKIELLNQRDDIYIAEPNFIFHPDAAPGFTGVWPVAHRDNIGWNALETFQANAPQIIVGIIDSGIESAHEQLNGRMHWGNPHNAQTTWHRDFSTGVRAGNPVVNPTDPRLNAAGTQVIGHGTQTAGMVAAMHWNVRFVCLRVFPANAGAQSAWIANAIDYARGRGIQILNYSGSGYGTAAAIATSLNQFTGLFVTSAGNNGQNRDTDTQWGNAATQTRTIVVGAHSQAGGRSVWNPDPRRVDANGNIVHQSSSFGANRVHIYAPGGGAGNINAPSPPGTAFRNYSGTSAAAPFVSGATKRH